MKRATIKPKRCAMCDNRIDAAKIVVALDGTVAVYLCRECEERLVREEYRCHG